MVEPVDLSSFVSANTGEPLSVEEQSFDED